MHVSVALNVKQAHFVHVALFFVDTNDRCLCSRCCAKCFTDVKNLCDNVIKILVGKSSEGFYSGWAKDVTHRAQSEKLGVFEDIWPDAGGDLPWRLTKEQQQLLDLRMQRVMWPHYIEPLEYKNASFWVKPSRMWKARRKFRLLFYVLPTMLRDQVTIDFFLCFATPHLTPPHIIISPHINQVPAVREAITLFAWAMRRLDGQVFCFDVAHHKLGVLPGSPVLVRAAIKFAHKDLVRSLALLEGCLPLSHLKPAMHHFVHYAEYVLTHGNLRFYWMMCFERYNKYIKNLVRNVHHVEVNLARTTSESVAVAFMNLQDACAYNPVEDDLHKCVLSSRDPKYVVTCEDLANLRMCGAVIRDSVAVKAFKIAKILGRHFRAGEWMQRPRCGSVITLVVNGRSLYARVHTFLKVDGEVCPGYAKVSWFGAPEYQDSEKPLVVSVTKDASEELLAELRTSIVRITRIDPSQVMVEEVPSSDTFYVMRDSGFDTLPL